MGRGAFDDESRRQTHTLCPEQARLRHERQPAQHPTKRQSKVRDRAVKRQVGCVFVVKSLLWETFTMSENTLTITDNRTGKQYQLPIENGTIKAMDLRQIKVADDDFGLMTYDPAFMNTASCKSRITFIDGDKGILEYRGYPIDQLAEKSTYLEAAYLLLHGELPTSSQLAEWTRNITYHTFINENIKKVMDGFHYNAHPMGMFEASLAALSTFYPDAKDIFNVEHRCKQIYRLIAK